jgi:hypothetical protein
MDGGLVETAELTDTDEDEKPNALVIDEITATGVEDVILEVGDDTDVATVTGVEIVSSVEESGPALPLTVVAIALVSGRSVATSCAVVLADVAGSVASVETGTGLVSGASVEDVEGIMCQTKNRLHR